MRRPSPKTVRGEPLLSNRGRLRRMSQTVQIPVPIGELFDKITILEIKTERIRDKSKLKNIELELHLLMDVANSLPQLDPSSMQLRRQLKDVNEFIWDAEESVRNCDKNQVYGPEFIDIARAIRRNNDRRAEIKRRLSVLTGSPLMEEKSFDLPEI
jgi:hypothetical protein